MDLKNIERLLEEILAELILIEAKLPEPRRRRFRTTRPPVVPLFVNECCSLGAECSVPPPVLWEAFKTWCAASNQPLIGKTKFYEWLRDEFKVTRVRRTGATVEHFAGITLRP